MPRFQIRQRAANGERFAPDAFASQIGKTIPVKSDDNTVLTEGTLVAAEVVDDGRAVDLIIETVHELAARGRPHTGMSFGWAKP